MAKVITVKSQKNMEKIFSDFEDMEKRIVDIGITKHTIKKVENSDGTVEQKSLAMIYKIQEEGLGRVPKRPTLIPGILDAKYGPRVNNLLGNIFAGNGFELGLNKIGEVATLKVKSNIQGIKTPPLSPFTIANRVNVGTTNPLVDTGQLKREIGWKISIRGGRG